MDIIDFHIHPFLDKQNDFCKYRDTVKDYKQIKTDMTRAGITKVCGSVIRRGEVKDFSVIKAFNDEALKLKELFEGFYIPGIHIHPDFPKESCEELERMYNKGVRVVGELVPYLMGWETYYNDNMKKIYECIDSFNMIVSMHTMDEEGMEKAVKNFPNITFVAAHPGDTACFLRHIERIKKYPHYYLDLSGTGIFRYGLIKYGVEHAGSERLVFGTDYPICNPGMYVAAVEYEDISQKDKENIFYNNVAKLLNLK